MYFLMCHDAAGSGGPKVSPQVIAYRTMIAYFLREGYNIALSNGLEWHDTKVCTITTYSHIFENKY